MRENSISVAKMRLNFKAKPSKREDFDIDEKTKKPLGRSASLSARHGIENACLWYRREEGEIKKVFLVRSPFTGLFSRCLM